MCFRACIYPSTIAIVTTEPVVQLENRATEDNETTVFEPITWPAADVPIDSIHHRPGTSPGGTV